jgi:hypothetical protein
MFKEPSHGDDEEFDWDRLYAELEAVIPKHELPEEFQLLLKELDTFQADPVEGKQAEGELQAACPSGACETALAAHDAPRQSLSLAQSKSDAAKPSPPTTEMSRKVTTGRRKSAIHASVSIGQIKEIERRENKADTLSSYKSYKRYHKDKHGNDVTWPGDKPALESPLNRKPPTWKFATDELRVGMFNRIVRESGGKAFTLHLGPKGLPKKSGTLGETLDYAHRRIKRHLDRALGRNVDFWAALDISPEGVLHLHGAVAIGVIELPAANEALRKAGGQRSQGRGIARDLDMRDLWGPDGWAFYAFKDAKGVRKAFPQRSKNQLFTATRRLLQESKELYRQLREKVIAARRGDEAQGLRARRKPSKPKSLAGLSCPPRYRGSKPTRPHRQGDSRSASDSSGACLHLHERKQHLWSRVPRGNLLVCRRRRAGFSWSRGPPKGGRPCGIWQFPRSGRGVKAASRTVAAGSRI